MDKPRRRRPILGRVAYPTPSRFGAASARRQDGAEGATAPTLPKSGTFPRSARSIAASLTVNSPAISTRHPQLMMTVVAPRRPLGHTVQRKPPARPAIETRLRGTRRRQPYVFKTLYAFSTPVNIPISGRHGVCFAPPLLQRRSCPLRHTRGFVTSISALPNCCINANHSSVRPGTQRSLRDTHRALLGRFSCLAFLLFSVRHQLRRRRETKDEEIQP